MRSSLAVGARAVSLEGFLNSPLLLQMAVAKVGMRPATVNRALVVAVARRALDRLLVKAISVGLVRLKATQDRRDLASMQAVAAGQAVLRQIKTAGLAAIRKSREPLTAGAAAVAMWA
jgi:hypothetical protein